VQGEFYCGSNCKYGFWVAILIIVNIKFSFCNFSKQINTHS